MLLLHYLFVVTLVSLYVIYVVNRFKYWDKKSVPNVKPFTPFGNITQSIFGLKSLGVTLQEYYNKFKHRGAKYFGFYLGLTPVFVPVDVELIKRMLTKDFNYFGTRTTYHRSLFPFHANLYNVEHQQWQVLRPKFDTIFDSNTMKKLCTTIQSNAEELLKSISHNSKSASVDVTKLSQLYAFNVLQECLVGEKSNVQSKYDELILNRILRGNLKTFLLGILREDPLNPAQIIKAILTDGDIVKYFTRLAVREVKHFKVKGKHSSPFMQNFLCVVAAKNRGDLNFVEIAAHLCTYYLSALTHIFVNLSFSLYELSKDQSLQSEARNEVLNELQRNGGNKVKYKNLMNFKLLEGIILECFRMYPVDFAIQRVCTNSYNIPETNVTINKGTLVLIPTKAINYNDELYENANKFDPWRIRQGGQKLFELHFGSGPRNCLGRELGMAIIKMALIYVLKTYKLSVNETKTGNRIETEHVTNHYTFVYKNRIFVDFQKL